MNIMAPATMEDARDHGLTPEEFDRARSILGRTPNMVELGIFSVLWSEHCSYKSSKVHLRKFPTEAPWVLQGPGENAGIVDIGDGWAVAFKMESHNHPSFIEPYQGAATGVGGILRDVFTMGARCIACMDSLRFGDIDAPRMRFLVDGVVGGIAGYGNCMGIPTIGGETTFFPAYDKNILVNAFALGVVRHDAIFRAHASGAGNPVIYVGSKTGRDGIHGATMASEEFDKDSEAKRPNVQVGDPFTEKLLMEACLQLMQGDAVVGIQDMGAAGLTSSSFEMCGRAGTGMRLNLDAVPLREEGMNPYEIMLSESQERMLIVATSGREQEVLDLFAHWGLDATVVAVVTDDGVVRATWRGQEVLAIPAEPLSTQSPVYNRPTVRPAYLDELTGEEDLILPPPSDMSEELRSFIASPNLCSKRWIWRQYDHMVRINTAVTPGLGAGVIRIVGTNRAVAMTSDVNPLYCYLDPRNGTAHAVAEAALNLACVGAKPLGLTDCLNFGNPEKPDIMYQFAESVEGMAEACRALEIPVVSGNVSFYNETEGEAIWPTPTVAVVGVVDSVDHLPVHSLTPGARVFLVGEAETRLAASLYAYMKGSLTGRIPGLDLPGIRKTADTIREAFSLDLVEAAHDISTGGLAAAVSELAAFYRTGITLSPQVVDPLRTLFGEGCGTALVISNDPDRLKTHFTQNGVSVQELGKVGGDRFTIEGTGVDLSLQDLIDAYEETLPQILEV